MDERDKEKKYLQTYESIYMILQAGVMVAKEQLGATPELHQGSTRDSAAEERQGEGTGLVLRRVMASRTWAR